MITSYDDTKNGIEEHTNSPMITDSELKINGEFMKILKDNAFNGMNREDVTDHIPMVLKIIEWIKIPNVEKNELRLHSSQNHLVEMQRHVPDDLDNRTNYFEFIYWLVSKFDNYWEIEKNTKNGLWEFYVNERTKGTIGDLEEYKKPCEENTKKTCSDTFYKPYLDAQEANDIYEVIDKEYSSIPIPDRHDIDNPDELCRIEEFTVVRHSIGNDEEFVTEPYVDLAETMIWYTLKKTRVELIWAF
ncbi:hypothetical protein Tco_0092482 [Tanacetum coccineum]